MVDHCLQAIIANDGAAITPGARVRLAKPAKTAAIHQRLEYAARKAARVSARKRDSVNGAMRKIAKGYVASARHAQPPVPRPKTLSASIYMHTSAAAVETVATMRPATM
jgi:hypothetical protein